MAEIASGEFSARGKPKHFLFVAAGLIIVLLHATHFTYCQRSTLPFMEEAFTSSDMNAYLQWARGIRDQGWLNPRPYHPWLDWMQAIAPYPQWVQWWGGEQIFQQSPLYAYLLSIFVRRLVLMRVLQMLMNIGTCVFIGLFAARISGRAVGWIAFWLAALYAPFYAYSWAFMREGLTWFISAGLLWALAELIQTPWPSVRASRFAWLTGLVLGLGFLARETYLLLIPAALVALAYFARCRKYWGYIGRVAVAMILVVTPLVIRNWVVKAPLLSTSNRLVENFIVGNAGGAQVYDLVFPPETGPILYQTNARPVPVFLATIASHPDGVRGWLRLQFLKFLSLFDPYESPDNLSIYFVAKISPVVRLGIRYWAILPVALAGLIMGIASSKRTHLWIWICMPIFFLSLFVGVPLSRYRQSLALFFIPLAAYFLVQLYKLFRDRQLAQALACSIGLLIGWGLILGPLARQPRKLYERPAEYVLSARIYRQLGDDDKARAILTWVRYNFQRPAR